MTVETILRILKTREEAAKISALIKEKKDINSMQERKQRIQETSFNTNANYAMKSYQASQKNPYTSSMHRPIAKRPAVAQPVQRANENKVVKRPVTSIKTDLAPATTATAPIAETKKYFESQSKFFLNLHANKLKISGNQYII